MTSADNQTDNLSVNSNALKSMDVFYKDCYLMFDDVVRCIKERAFEILEDEYKFSLNATQSQNRRHCIFKVPQRADRIYFALMLIKMRDDLFNDTYNSICDRLEVDSEFPLLIVTGFIEPVNGESINYKGRDEKILRGLWIYHTLQVSHGKFGNNFTDPNRLSPFTLESGEYDFKIPLNLRVRPDIGEHWWCENATFRIRRLTDITDSKAVADIVEELLSMRTSADANCLTPVR